MDMSRSLLFKHALSSMGDLVGAEVGLSLDGFAVLSPSAAL